MTVWDLGTSTLATVIYTSELYFLDAPPSLLSFKMTKNKLLQLQLWPGLEPAGIEIRYTVYKIPAACIKHYDELGY